MRKMLLPPRVLRELIPAALGQLVAVLAQAASQVVRADDALR